MSVSIDPRAIVDEGVVLPDGCRVWAFAHIRRGAVLGAECNVGEGAFIEGGARLGRGCVVKNGVYIWDRVVADDYVFFGPNCTLTNVFTPRAHPRYKGAQADWRPTYLREGVTVGAGAVVVCGVTVGRYALIGAGAVVTRNVGDQELVVGAPARRLGFVCECGRRLDARGRCPQASCGRAWRVTSDGVLGESSAGDDGVGAPFQNDEPP